MKVICFIRSILATIWFLIATIVFGSTLILGVAFTGSQSIIDSMSFIWGRTIQWAFNMHVQVTGEENIPPGGCLLLFNHSSHFDIVTIYGRLKRRARFGAKIELFKIPLFGRILRSAGMLPITRADREGVLKLYEQSIDRVHNGESFLLAAEGTRQMQPGVGAKFKSGPFIFAITGQFPIVPIVIRGAAECLPKGRLLACKDRWRHNLKLQFLPPISTKGLTLEDRSRLQDEARALMTKAYEQS